MTGGWVSHDSQGAVTEGVVSHDSQGAATDGVVSHAATDGWGGGQRSGLARKTRGSGGGSRTCPSEGEVVADV